VGKSRNSIEAERNEQARIRSKKWREANAEALRIVEKQRRALPENQARAKVAEHKWRTENPKNYMLGRLRASAKKRNIEFSLTIEDLPDVPEFCPVLGIPLLQTELGEGRGPNSISVDRVDSTKGYIPSNIQIISWRANQLKSALTLQEIRDLLRYVETHIQ
jgi:hypothetical protein